MNISRENYEPFFLDYLEGNLDENMIDQFLDFLESNPDLKEELHLFENVRLPEEPINFSGKELLYKSSAEAKTSLENKTIAYLEGDLESEERELFETYLAGHPELKKEYVQFSKTKLQPDTSIIFQEKNKLYKKTGAAVFMNWTTRAAAVLILLWGINAVIQNVNQPVTQNSVPIVAEIITKPGTFIKKNEPGIKDLAINATAKLKTSVETIPVKAKNLREPNQERPKETMPADSYIAERDLTTLAQISPIIAQVDPLPLEASLAISKSNEVEIITDRNNIMTIEEYLASRAKKVSNGGLLSAQRIARVGLRLASELSGDRIGYNVKDGKISNVGFESKLLAFSIPLDKK